MLARFLDHTDAPEVRRTITPLTAARVVSTATYRLYVPFLATIARGLGVSVAQLGVVLAVTELFGLTSPLIGRLVDRLPRRPAMLIGLLGVSLGGVVCATAANRVMFGVGIVLIGQGKTCFDVTGAAWFSDHVSYERRGRVIGLSETSWALGLLGGVSVLGIFVEFASWRWAYGVAAIGLTPFVWYIGRHSFDRRAPAAHDHNGERAVEARWIPKAWLAIAASCLMVASAQCLFLTFGPWLEDERGFTAGSLSVVAFMLGAGELFASSGSAVFTDRWGKARSVMVGAALMVPTALLFGLQWPTVAAVAVLVVFLIGFEFGIVSGLSTALSLAPGAPGRGLGLMLAFGTIGRSAVSIPATALYERHGVVPPTLMAAAFGVLAVTAAASRFKFARH